MSYTQNIEQEKVTKSVYFIQFTIYSRFCWKICLKTFAFPFIHREYYMLDANIQYILRMYINISLKLI